MTHNYDPQGAFLKNLCDLPEAGAERVLARIRASGTRSIKTDYLARRLTTEDWLIAERTKRLGSTPRQRPIYAFLGDYADGEDGSRPASLVMPLAAFPREVLTFTYPDSMASLPLGTEDKHGPHRQAYHGRVFTLPEIRDIVATFGMPGDGWKTEPARRYDRFIEVQVWDDRPILDFLKQA